MLVLVVVPAAGIIRPSIFYEYLASSRRLDVIRRLEFASNFSFNLDCSSIGLGKLMNVQITKLQVPTSVSHLGFHLTISAV